MDTTNFDDPVEVLRISHEQLRRGDYFPELHEAVQKYEKAWREFEDEALWLEGRAVAAEVLDYFGDYAAAAACLPADDPRFWKAKHSEEDSTPALEKRRIYLLIALAHSEYRHERLEPAGIYLNLAQSRLDQADPGKRKHLGTRARLAYSYGQLARNQQRFSDALAHFSACSYYASERLRARTPDLELTGPPTITASAASSPADAEAEARRARQRDNDQRYTTWVIGKSLAFGMGWVHHMMGNLTAARHAIGAGYSMLRGTGDWIHRAYAQMLMAATERAQFSDDPAAVDRALVRVREAEQGLRPHPTFGGRAAFETALTCWYAKRPHEALEALKRTKSATGATDPGTIKTVRSTCNGLVLESRAYRELGRETAARRASEDALKRAKTFKLVVPMVNALVNSAETDIYFAKDSQEPARHPLERAERRLKEALKLLADNPNPKMESSCMLHLARTLHKLDRQPEAEDMLDVWRLRYGTNVEHGFLKGLAADVTRELGYPEERFVVDSTTRDLELKPRLEELRQFMIRLAEKRAQTPTEQARLLGINYRTLIKYPGQSAINVDAAPKRKPRANTARNKS